MILTDTDAERGEWVFEQIAQLIFAHKLSVGTQASNVSLSKALQKLVEQAHALIRVGIAPFVEQAPHQRKSHSFMHHPQHQNVEGALPKLPLRSVNGEHPRFWNRHQSHYRLGNLRVVHFIVAKESLETLIVRIRLSLPTERRCEFSKVNGFNSQQLRG